MSIAARIVLACLAIASMSGSHAAATNAAADDAVAADSFSKLRKIHLVRPDLIAYPLAIDFIC